MAPTPSATLPAWGSFLIAGLDAADQSARKLLTGLSAEQLNWQPRPGVWSIGQCLEHLAITNELYLAAIAGSLDGQPASAVSEIEIGWFGRWFIKSFIEPGPETKKAKAPGKIVPGSRVELSVLDRFLRSNQLARDVVRRAREYDVNRIRFKNPFLPLIRFTVGTGLTIVPGHDHRHLLQAERVKAAPGFPG